MLVLTRFIDQKIIIDSDIKITVLNVDDKSNKVWIGIKAPKSVSVHREEVYKRIQEAQQGHDH
ncbi:carbon storage regulator CsrA [Zophobihabitans entericus]|uniref:Translational regulator CsrA n=1 Tax=Zophobihabitans entericus TaxID=1635327 RepID=A0A6G9IE63_9GAMM|nr:carbon storage regulator CsrA [Zophobihabitans entericus]QIQ22531.1 carbon storage regulator CsrA [Zophobihabitans entericus]